MVGLPSIFSPSSNNDSDDNNSNNNNNNNNNDNNSNKDLELNISQSGGRVEATTDPEPRKPASSSFAVAASTDNNKYTTTSDDNNNNNNNSSSNTSRNFVRNFTMPNLFDTRNKKIGWLIFGIIVLITCISLLATSLQKVQSTEYGIEYNVHNKQLDEIAKGGGLHIGPPGYKFIKFPSTFVTVNLPDGVCVSQDGLLIQFSVTFQYQMPKEYMLPAIKKYRNFDKWATVVEAAGTSAVQHACSDFGVIAYQNQRGIIQTAMEEHLKNKLEGPERDGEGGVWARAISLQLNNVFLPTLYKDAVAAKQAAAEDIELAKNQRNQETTKAQTLLLAAQEEARKILDSAINDANVTLTEATLRAEEIEFAFETEAQVLLQAKTSFNLTTEGMLAYLSNRLYESVPNLVVSAGEPAKLSRKDEL